MKKCKKEVRRAVKVEGTDLVLELSKATAIRTDKNMIHFDQLPDGTWRLIYNANLIPDFTKVKSFKMIREDLAQSTKDLAEQIANMEPDETPIEKWAEKLANDISEGKN